MGAVLRKRVSVMAERKKAYQRFEELTRQATAGLPPETDPAGDPVATDALWIRLPPEMRRALEQMATTDRTTPSAIVHEALRRYLELPS